MADVNECAAPSNPCVVGTCVNTDGAYSCVCPRGFYFNGRFCEDRNECAEFLGDLCPGGGSCINTAGSYRCACPPKFSFVDGKCISMRGDMLLLFFAAVVGRVDGAEVAQNFEKATMC